MSTSTLLIGYDVESPQPDVTQRFLRAALSLHTDLDVPATFFLVGRTVVANVDSLRPFAAHPLFDLQQHTYAHTRLKTVCMEKPDGSVELYEGGSLQKIRSDVRRASQVLQDELGVAPIGLCGPYCYYRGLMDRPDILKVLHSAGIRFTRTYGRNEKDFQPVSFAVQPFWYDAQGFGDVLEIPLNGWQDVYLRWQYGWEDVDSYIAQLKRDCAEAAQRGAVWSFCTHDWSSIREDEGLRAVRELVGEARSLGMEIMTHRAYYERRVAQKKSAP
jgi:peptidoglycan/xylan/chitin deacetylase (PgdA/CDA1 family)